VIYRPANPAIGTRPAEVPEADVPRFIRGMFDRIAPRYDLANHVLSLGFDFYWRWRAVRALDGTLRELATGSPPVIIDICCGTGDLATAVLVQAMRRRRGRPAYVFMTDFSHAMLQRGRAKAHRNRRNLIPFEADALQLPLSHSRADLLTSAFGFRNLADYSAALAEFYRVLKPGGRLLILEFSQTVLPIFRNLFGWYFAHLLPRLGGWIAGDENAYRYLPASVSRFPSPAELTRLMQSAGYLDVRFCPLTGGIAVLHTATKPA
jgi:demethylmenaquinone methyltransferase/2-methoxy-6-polyprenyl-1,4-benzoquinol methylase